MASLAIGAGQDIRTLSDLLGHSRTSITTDIYAHVLPHRRRELTRAISQIVFGGDDVRTNADDLRTPPTGATDPTASIR